MRYPVGRPDVTRLLAAAEAGDPKAAAELLPLVYDELRRLAAARMAEERSEHALQPTALVHEAYLRLDVAAANSSGNTVSVLVNDQSWPAPPPTASVSDVVVTEGNAGTANATFTLTLSSASDAEVTVRYSTADGNAVAGSDYQALSGTLVFAPGETSKTITVAIVGDQIFEPNETFTLNLSNPTGAVIADGTGVGTIVNDDTYVTSSISDVSKAEGRNGNTMFTFTVTLSAPSTTVVTVNYSTANGTAAAGSDYEAAAGTLTFAPGETTKTITIKVKGDRTKEADETFFVNLSGVSGDALLFDPQGIGTILNDD